MKYEDLKILDELREKGSISEEEYQREKEKILNDQENTLSNAGKNLCLGSRKTLIWCLCTLLNLQELSFRWPVS